MAFEGNEEQLQRLKQDVKAWKRSEEVKQARGAYEEALARNDRAQADLQRARQLHAQKAVSQGAFDEAMMDAANEVIVVADNSKLGRPSLSQLCELSEPDRLVVDSGISEEWRDRLVAAGVNLLVAGSLDNE